MDLLNLGKKIASVAIDFDNKEKDSEVAAEEATPAVNSPTLVSAIPGQPAPVSENDPAYVELSKAVLDRDSPYTKFLKRFGSLKKVRDLDTRYQTALDVLADEGVSKEDILRSIMSHVGLLGVEKANFENTIRTHVDESVGGLLRQFEEINNSIKLNDAEISRIKTVNEKNQKALAEIQVRIGSAKKKTESATQSFNSAFAAIAKKLESDKDKLSSLS